MAMGLSYNNYWYGDPGLVKYYKAAHEIQCEMRHAQAHLDGLYTYIAFSKVMAAAFSKEGGNFSYPEKPLPRTLKESDAAQLKILQAQQDRAKMYLTMYATQNKKKEG
jgi:hypothetical protein